MVFLIMFLLGKFLTVTWWMLPILLVLYYGIYGLAIIFTRSFDQEDIALLLVIEKRVGLNLIFIKRFLGRFV